jgi:hypothetical protein
VVEIVSEKIPLKLCPFCGDKAMVHTLYMHGQDLMYRAECDNVSCALQPMTQWHKDEGVVRRAWNRRAGDENT